MFTSRSRQIGLNGYENFEIVASSQDILRGVSCASLVIDRKLELTQGLKTARLATRLIAATYDLGEIEEVADTL